MLTTSTLTWYRLLTMKPADKFLIVPDTATYQPERSKLVSHTPDDLRDREARNVDELLIQMPVDGEVVVKLGEHLALRVYTEGGKKHVEAMTFIGAEPVCVIMPLTSEQCDRLAAALFTES